MFISTGRKVSLICTEEKGNTIEGNKYGGGLDCYKGSKSGEQGFNLEKTDDLQCLHDWKIVTFFSSGCNQVADVVTDCMSTLLDLAIDILLSQSMIASSLLPGWHEWCWWQLRVACVAYHLKTSKVWTCTTKQFMIEAEHWGKSWERMLRKRCQQWCQIKVWIYTEKRAS